MPLFYLIIFFFLEVQTFIRLSKIFSFSKILLLMIIFFILGVMIIKKAMKSIQTINFSLQGEQFKKNISKNLFFLIIGIFFIIPSIIIKVFVVLLFVPFLRNKILNFFKEKLKMQINQSPFSHQSKQYKKKEEDNIIDV